jgi:hypothetical protein
MRITSSEDVVLALIVIAAIKNVIAAILVGILLKYILAHYLFAID